MSWIPTFLSPLTAIIAGAVAIPLLLVLYFLKLRRREMAVSSTLLWKKAIQDLQVNAPFQKLRRNLLLLLQMLLLLLLLLALSRPVTHFVPGAGKTTVILIDRSASMATRDANGKSRLEEAKRRAKDLVETLDRNAQAMVIAFDESAETRQGLTSDVPLLKRAIDGIEQTDQKSKLKLAYQLAEAQTHFSPEQLRPGAGTLPDVWLYSDGRVTDAADLTIRGNLKYDKLGSDKTGNVAIVAMNAKRNYERPTEVQVFARLANFGPDPVNADVQMSVDGRIVAVRGTALPPERWTDAQRDKFEVRDSLEFTVDLPAAGIIKLEQMHKAGDGLSADDSASVVVPPPKQLAVLLVSEGNPFLELALSTLNLQSPQSLLPSAYEEQKPTKFDVIWFDRYQPKFLPPAGSFVYFGAVPPNSKITGDPPAYVTHNADSQHFVSVIDWKREHPILRGVPLGRHVFADPIVLKAPPEAEVLAEGSRGPLMVLYRTGFQTHLVMGFDVIQSTLPTKPDFPVMMVNMMQYLAVGSDMDVRPSLEPGATPRIPRASLQKLGADVKSIELTGPMGDKKVPIPPAGDFALPPLDRVGVYSTDPAVPGFEHVAVNLLDQNESNVIPLDKPPGGVGEALANTGGKSRLELWWWIVAFGALPLLLIEWWVYTRRVHL